MAPPGKVDHLGPSWVEVNFPLHACLHVQNNISKQYVGCQTYYCGDTETTTITSRTASSCKATVKLVATGDPSILTSLRGPANVLPAACNGDFRSVACTIMCAANASYGLPCSGRSCPGSGPGGVATPLELDPPPFSLHKTGKAQLVCHALPCSCHTSIQVLNIVLLFGSL